MNPYEEELQQNIEKGNAPDGDDLDIKAYREVFSALQKQPGYVPSGRFAEQVVARVIRNQQQKDSKDYFWFGAGLFFLALAFLGTVLYTGFQLDFGFLEAMADYKGLAIFGVAFVIFLNWLDKRLIKGRTGSGANG